MSVRDRAITCSPGPVIGPNKAMTRTQRLVVTSVSTPEDRLYVLKLDRATGALAVDDAFRDVDGATGFSFAYREWPHGWKGVGTPHGAVFSR